MTSWMRQNHRRHDHVLTHTADRPHDFASPILRVYQYHYLRRQMPRRVSPPGGQVASKDIGRVSAGFSGKRAAEKIYPPARVARRISGVSAEPRGPKSRVPRHRAGNGQSSYSA